jgi:hypothetical protein
MDAQEIKQLKELQDAYLSVYEAKKVDQDEDGDNDFADVRIARMIASGVSKEEAIRRVRNKEYNEEFELWVNDLLDEGYDLSDYTWDEMYESYLNEATRMRKELGKKGEIATRKELAKRSNAYQRSGSVDKTIATAEREADRTTPRNRDEVEGAYRQRMADRSGNLRRLAANRRKSVRGEGGLRGYAADVEGDDKDLQSARGSARSAGTLTPREKKQLGEQYNLVLSYLLDEGYANTQESALAIMANMSEEWRESIVEGMGLSVGSAKMIGKLTSNPRTPEAQATKAAQKNITDPIGFAVKGATKAVLGVGDEKNKQMMQKRFPN